LCYIDSVILRDRDASTAWTTQSDGTLEERVYYCQNWRGDVSVLLTEAGTVLEWVKYLAYGRQFGLPGGDLDGNGHSNVDDASELVNLMGTGGYRITADVNLDGDADADDLDVFTWGSMGWGTLSLVGNRFGYAGYHHAPELAGTVWDARHRRLHSVLGVWDRHDRLGYIDGMNLYQYVRGMAMVGVDPTGLAAGCGLAFGTNLFTGVPEAICGHPEPRWRRRCRIVGITITAAGAVVCYACPPVGVVVCVAGAGITAIPDVVDEVNDLRGPPMPVVGACCLSDGSCGLTTRALCTGPNNPGGVYHGDHTTCTSPFVWCRQPLPSQCECCEGLRRFPKAPCDCDALAAENIAHCLQCSPEEQFACMIEAVNIYNRCSAACRGPVINPGSQ
jgi:RHS repeat-associated protein